MSVARPTHGFLEHRFLEHTGEVEVAIRAPTEAEIFAEALRAFRDLVAADGPVGEPLSRPIALDAPDRPALLARFVDELVFLAEVEQLVPDELTGVEVSETSLHAVVGGRRGPVRHLVKGATLSRLEFCRDSDGWRARVVLDV